MTYSRRAGCTLAVAAAVLLPVAPDAQAPPTDAKKPSIALRATPPVGFAPLRVRGSVDVRDGSNDYPDFYCASVEWDWGDGTISENYSDCDPYVAGKSTIQRRFTAEHIYRQGGAYRIIFRLKQKTKAVGNATTNVQVRSGVGEAFGR